MTCWGSPISGVLFIYLSDRALEREEREREREYGRSRVTKRTEPMSNSAKLVLKGSIARVRDKNKAEMQLSG